MKAMKLKVLAGGCAVLFAGGAMSVPVPRAALAERLQNGPEIIGLVHWTVNSFEGREWGYGDEDPAVLNPSDFSADQIVGACKEGGIGGLVVVAKHHDGFCLWPSETTEQNISKSPFRGGKGDYMMEMSEACRKHAVKFGVYVSPWDRNNAHYASEKYVEIFHNQVRELIGGKYGEVFELWFDGANGGDGWYGGAKGVRKIKDGYYRFDEIFRFARQLQPKICIFDGEEDAADFRWPGNEKGFLAPDSRATIETVGGYENTQYGNPNYGRQINLGSPAGKFFRVCEADFPLRRTWFWRSDNANSVKSPEYLMKIYLRSVGNGGIMNIGIAPDNRGRLEDAEVKALHGFTDMRRRFFSREVTSGPANLLVLSEDIVKGERVCRWSVSCCGKEILNGKSIGLKRMRTLPAAVNCENLSVAAFDAAGNPVPVACKSYRVDDALLNQVLAAKEPAREERTYGTGTEIFRDAKSVVYRYDGKRIPFGNVVLVPDEDNPGGAPAEFKLFISDDGKTWRQVGDTYRLDNVAANPFPQDVVLGSTVTASFIRIESVRSVKEGAPLALVDVEYINRLLKN